MHDTDTNQEYILRKVENYPTYRIPYILREVGNITNIKKIRKVGNHPTDTNEEYIMNGRKLSYIWNS